MVAASAQVTASNTQKSAPQDFVQAKTNRFIKGTVIEKPPQDTDGDGVMGILCHPMNILLICLPLGVVSHYMKYGDLYVFWFMFFSMVPLAKILGDATEELAASLKNDMVAGLLNATFGNAVEMVITVQLLRAGLYPAVKSTLLGSVLSNTLLVLGMSFFAGGVWTQGKSKEKVPADQKSLTQYADAVAAGQEPGSSCELDIGDALQIPTQVSSFQGEKIQSFSVLGALVNTSMLLISCMSFSLITVFRQVAQNPDADYDEKILLPVSRISSIIIMMAYVAYIIFQLFTHKEAMAEDSGDGGEEEEAHISTAKAVALLGVSTIIVSFCSELLVSAIETVTEKTSLSEHFIGIILLPIVGNACEHAAAVRFAVQDKLGLSVSIAVGSSTQIALFVVPFAVLSGWVMDRPMDLNFGTLNTAMITLSVIVVLSMVVDGQSNWLQGYLLMSVYCIIAVMYWYLPDDMERNDEEVRHL